MNYAFIHINKCAGSAIKHSLNWDTGKYQKGKHETIATIKPRLDEDTFTFAFIRNPWSRIASMYRYRKYNLRRVKLRGVSFEEWFWKAFKDSNYTAVQLMNKPCWDWISIDDKIAVDFVGKYENLEEDFNKVCDILGFDAHLEIVNPSKNNDMVFYTPEMRKLVEQQFKKDLELYS
jgi:hypothetical protein